MCGERGRRELGGERGVRGRGMGGGHPEPTAISHNHNGAGEAIAEVYTHKWLIYCGN